MSTAFAELYSLINAAYVADTGSTGLNDSTKAANAYLRGEMWRSGDTDNRDLNWPKVIVSVVNQQETDSFGINKVEMVGQFDIIAKADNRFAALDAVASRLRAVYHQVVLSGGTQWNFNEMVFKTEQQAQPPSDNESRAVIRWQITGRKVA